VNATAIFAAAVLCTLVLSSGASANVSAVSFTPATSAAGATGNWTIGFTSSSSGALAGGAGNGYIDVTFPNGFTIPSPSVSGTWGSGFSCNGQGLIGGNIGGQTIEVNLPTGCTLGNSTAAVLTLNGITNPGTPGTYSGAAVATSAPADQTPVAANDITITAAKASPTISTSASGGVTIGGSVHDTATLSGGSSPTGTLTFKLYGPNDSSCSGSPAVTGDVTVSGNGSYDSAAFVPSAVGTYRWIASYSGDGSNNAVSGACNDANESVVVSKASPTISTSASGGVTIGGSVHDTATLSGGSSPTGSLTFKLYGPNDSSCSGSATFTGDVTVSGNGSYDSAAFVPTAVGTYRWVASYSGDTNNNAFSGACGDANESVVVSKASPTISTSASAGVTLGGSVKDTATLSGGFSPTGTLTFKLYGPNDSNCSGAAVFSSDVAISFSFDSASFTPSAVGTYRWVASYSGDTNNNAASGVCNDANESVSVTSPPLHSTATAVSCKPQSPSPGESTTCTATVTDTASSGRTTPTGAVEFSSKEPPRTCSLSGSGSSASCHVKYTEKTYTGKPSGMVWRPAVRSITASYGGDSRHTGSKKTTTVSVSPTELSGVVKSPHSACLGGREVTLQRKKVGQASFTNIGKDKSATHGAYSVHTTPVANAQYRATVRAKALSFPSACKAATSAAVTWRAAGGGRAGGALLPARRDSVFANFNTALTIRFGPH
jgi:hypothetical protein